MYCENGNGSLTLFVEASKQTTHRQ